MMYNYLLVSAIIVTLHFSKFAELENEKRV